MVKLMNYQHFFNLILKQICQFVNQFFLFQLLMINFKFTNCYKDHLGYQQLICFGPLLKEYAKDY